MKLPDEIKKLATSVVAQLKAQKLTLATAESCTGGLIAGAITAVPGSSEVLYGGFVTYANEAKIAMIGVPYSLLYRHGAVSQEVAIAMADGALGVAGTDLTLAVTGIAGPDGGSAEKPVGTVHFALAMGDDTTHVHKVFANMDRDAVRQATIIQALNMILKATKPK